MTQGNAGRRPSRPERSRPRDNPGRPQRSDVDILELYRPDISRMLSESNTPSYRRTQVLEHLLSRPDRPFAEASSLPLDLRTALDDLGASTLSVADSSSSDDGATKLLMRTVDDLAIEAVVMRYRDRVTACISSQVGCAVGCAFCATGALGLTRNLGPAEMVDQVRAVSRVIADEGRRLTNLVYMGMGEPLHNIRAVLQSIRILTDAKGMNMAHRAVSVSTVGVPAGIRRLALEEPQVNLAVSLHAADDATRSKLIPAQYRHPLASILDAAWEHFDATGRKLLVEYVLIGGVNDSVDQARKLATLLRGHVVAVNLLAWNPVPGRSVQLAGFAQPSPEAVASFRRTLLSARIETVVRQSKGAAIQAACGQLAARAAAKRPGGKVEKGARGRSDATRSKL